MVPTTIHTRIAGVASGKSMSIAGSANIPARQYYLRMVSDLGISKVDLVPEPENEYDPNAIAVYVTLPSGRFSLGYIPNDVGYCSRCSTKFSRPIPAECPNCIASDGVLVSIDRVGLATRLSGWIKEGHTFSARIISTKEVDSGYLGARLEISRTS